ncbi:MAG: murein biosynthesis integral membrane protein MurJ [Beutenbergiaceae bacterium]
MPGTTAPDADSTPADAQGRDSAPPRRRTALSTSAAVMAAGTLVSRVLGLLRNALLVAVLGLVAVGQAGSMADAWSVANKLPNIVSMLLAGGILNAVLVPQVVRAMQRKDGGAQYVNRLLTLAIAILAGITVVLTAAATLLINLYAAQFTPEWKAVAVALAYWCIPQLFFYGLYTLLGQVLNARQVFGPYMWAPALNNVVAISGLVAFLVIFGGITTEGAPAIAWTPDKIALLGGSATLGVAAQALILIVPLHRSGFRYRPVWGFRGHGLGKASTVASWAFAALAVGQLGYLAVSNLAAAASSSDVAGQAVAGNFAYDYAFLIFMLPQSLVTVSLVTALFTRLAANASSGAAQKVRDDLSFGVRTLSLFTVFATGAFAVLAIPLVQVVVLGNAGFAAYQAVGTVLVAMSMGLMAIAIWTMVQRVFYAYEDTRTLFRIQLPMAAILAIGCGLSWWLLEPQWWVAGAGAATTISNSFGAIIGYRAARKYLPDVDGRRVMRTHLRVILAMVPPALAGWGLLHLWGVHTSFWGAALRVVVLGLFMLGGYLLLLRMFGVAELAGLLARMAIPIRRILGRSHGPTKPRQLRTITTGGVNSGRGERSVSTDTSFMLAPGDLLADRYRLVEPLTDVVPDLCAWAGIDSVLDEPVRVLTVSSSQRSQVLDAARRAALIEDPRLPRILRVSNRDDYGFIVSDPLSGTSLTDLLAAGPLPPAQAQAIIGEAATVLETARRRGVHHLALTPSTILVTVDGAVVVSGLGIDAAAREITASNARAAGQHDATSLIQLLYTALTGTWPGPPELACGLPMAQQGSKKKALIPAGDVVPEVPSDLDALCALTLGARDGGPRTPGQVVAELSPWEAIEVGSYQRALPPTVPPSDDSADADHAAEAVAGNTVALSSGTGGPVITSPIEDPAEIDSAATAEADDIDLDTTHHADDIDLDTTHRSSEIRALLPPVPPVAPAPGGAPRPTAMPVFTAQPIGWDLPGVALPTAAPRSSAPIHVSGDAPGDAPGGAAESASAEPQPEVEQAPASTGAPIAGTLTASARATGRVLTSPFRGIRRANRRINQASARVEGNARSLLDDAGQRLGGFTGRVGSFVDDVRDEFRPVESGTESTDGRSRFNPSPIVLTVMIALVIFGLVLAIMTLRDAATSFVPGPNPGEDPPSASPADGTEPSTEPTATQEPTQAPVATSVTITEGITFDPTVTGGENQSDAYLAFDGNPATTWNSLRYNSPTYGMKPGLGFTVTLSQTALVSSITLDVQGHGGLVEIREGNPAAPHEGALLASGAMGSNVTYTFDEPVSADAISLWFPQLPVANSDGRNRIELAEITVR